MGSSAFTVPLTTSIDELTRATENAVDVMPIVPPSVAVPNLTSPAPISKACGDKVRVWPVAAETTADGPKKVRLLPVLTVPELSARSAPEMMMKLFGGGFDVLNAV